MSEQTAPRASPSDVLRMLRPSQWTKNLVVLAAFFFAMGDRGQRLAPATGLATALAATLLFCAVSSGVYVFNDIVDREADRLHPRKKHRPLASGHVPLGLARVVVAALVALGTAGAFAISLRFGLVVSAYVALQALYCLALKRVALLDILVIAAGFVLRAIGGAVVLQVSISPWLLLCAFLLALFLALCKRRHEKGLFADGPNLHRPSLEQYDLRLLDQLIAVVSAATLVSYAIYTLAPETAAKFGTRNLGFTIPIVLFGLFRYLDLVYRHQQGDRPEQILLTDLPILIALALYGVTVLAIFSLPR